MLWNERFVLSLIPVVLNKILSSRKKQLEFNYTSIYILKILAQDISPLIYWKKQEAI